MSEVDSPSLWRVFTDEDGKSRMEQLPLTLAPTRGGMVSIATVIEPPIATDIEPPLAR
jgi:hypothetical protein